MQNCTIPAQWYIMIVNGQCNGVLPNSNQLLKKNLDGCIIWIDRRREKKDDDADCV